MRVMACLLAGLILVGVAGPAIGKGGVIPGPDGQPMGKDMLPARTTSDPFTMPRWSPYIAGIGIGVLCCLAFLLSDRTIGCSTAFARSAGMIERLFKGKKVEEKPYYQQFKPHIEWEWMLVIGVLLGALTSSLVSGRFLKPTELGSWVPALWKTHVGGSAVVRWLVALFGGICVGFGARWAGGCTSGHGISGTLQLAVSSWIAAAGFFAGGIVTAVLLFRVLFP